MCIHIMENQQSLWWSEGNYEFSLIKQIIRINKNTGTAPENPQNK